MNLYDSQNQQLLSTVVKYDELVLLSNAMNLFD